MPSHTQLSTVYNATQFQDVFSPDVLATSGRPINGCKQQWPSMRQNLRHILALCRRSSQYFRILSWFSTPTGKHIGTERAPKNVQWLAAYNPIGLKEPLRGTCWSALQTVSSERPSISMAEARKASRPKPKPKAANASLLKPHAKNRNLATVVRPNHPF